MQELVIPAAAVRDANSIELMRAWIAEGSLHCALRIGRYWKSSGVSGERAWGIILADAARHISDALAQAKGSNEQETLSQIRQYFLAELGKPT
jgi:Domain of unknown function (DUF5076)